MTTRKRKYTNNKHPLVKTWEKWLASNKECLELPVGPKFLENRLWLAFMDGANAQEEIMKEELQLFFKSFRERHVGYDHD